MINTKHNINIELTPAYIARVSAPMLGNFGDRSVPERAIFCQRLNEILGTNLEAPPAHVTLYTGGTNPATSRTGIGIDTSAALKELHPEPIVGSMN